MVGNSEDRFSHNEADLVIIRSTWDRFALFKTHIFCQMGHVIESSSAFSKFVDMQFTETLSTNLCFHLFILIQTPSFTDLLLFVTYE